MDNDYSSLTTHGFHICRMCFEESADRGCLLLQVWIMWQLKMLHRLNDLTLLPLAPLLIHPVQPSLISPVAVLPSCRIDCLVNISVRLLNHSMRLSPLISPKPCQKSRLLKTQPVSRSVKKTRTKNNLGSWKVSRSVKSTGTKNNLGS